MRDTRLPLEAAGRHVAAIRDATFRRWFGTHTGHSPGKSQWWARPNARRASGALLVAVAYYLSALISLSITYKSTPISPVWPPNAILLVALLLVPMESWWVYLLAIFGAHMLVELPGGVPLATATGLYFTNAGEAVLGAYLVRRLSDGAPWLGTLRRVEVFLVCAVVVAPVVTSFGDAAIVALTRWGDNYADYWLNWKTRCVSDILTQLTVAPALLLAVTGARGWMRGASRLRWAEAAVLSATLLLVGGVAFGEQITPRGWAPMLVFAVLPVLFWAAVRFGVGGTSAALVGITVVATWSAAQGRGPFSADTPTVNAISLQLFLICICIPMLVLAAVIDDRQHALWALQASEIRYRDLVESQTEMVCRYLPDSTLTYVNEAFCRAYGKSREQVIGTKFFDRMEQPARDHHAQYTAALLIHPHTSVDEHEVVLPDGSIGWHQWVDHPIYDAEGQVVEIQAVGRDITKRKRAEEDLQASEARYRTVVRNLPNTVVLLFDAELRHTFAEGPGLQLLGLMPERLEGRTVGEALPDELAAALAPRYEAARSGQAADLDVEYAQHIYRTQIVPMPMAAASTANGTAPPAPTPVGMVVLRDITEQRRARDELVHERTRAAMLGALSQEFRTLAEHSPDLIARFDPAGRFVYLNQAGAARLGQPAAYWVGKTFAELGAPQSVFEPWAQSLRDVVQTRVRRTFDIEAPVYGGKVRSLHVRFIPEFADDGRTLLSVLGIATDVSALKQAEARLAEQASELEAVFEAKADGVAVFDLQGRFVRANSALRDLLGFDADGEYTSLSLEERTQRLQVFDEQGQLMSREQWPHWRVLRGEILTGANAVEGRVRALDGRERWISITGAPARDHNDQVVRAVLITRDVTARRALERQTAEQAAAAERNRLAHELHDTVTQEIYSAGLLAESVSRNWPVYRAEAESALAQLPAVIRGALAGLRMLLLELRPTTLEQLPLSALLRQLTEAMSNRANVPITIRLDGHKGTSASASDGTDGADGAEPLPLAVKVVFYRVAQEALVNAAKYAKARAISVQLRTHDQSTVQDTDTGTIELEIADDGQGFDPSATPAGHYGLAIMRERAQAVGATMQVRSQPGQGTQIVVAWRSEQLAAAEH